MNETRRIKPTPERSNLFTIVRNKRTKMTVLSIKINFKNGGAVGSHFKLHLNSLLFIYLQRKDALHCITTTKNKVHLLAACR